MPLFVLHMESKGAKAPLTERAVIEAGSVEDAAFKARDLWEDIDAAIFGREIPKGFEVPRIVVDMRVSQDVADAIEEKSGISRDDHFMVWAED